MGDAIVLAVVAAAVFFAVRSLRKSAKKGGCAGCSRRSHCTGHCESEHISK